MNTATKKKILLVDDEAPVCQALKKLLEKAGYDVVTAQDGATARDIAEREAFDVVVSDIHMPGGFGGMDLFRYMKTSRKGTPVVLMTGFASLSETKEAHEAGVEGFLAKPFNIGDLETVLKRIWGGSQPQAEAKPVDLDDQFSKLGIDDFISGRQIQYNIYVRLAATKYLKIAERGEDLAIDRIHKYKEKGIHHLYLAKSDFQKYMKLNLSLSQTLHLHPNLSAHKKLHLLKHTGEVIMERIYSDKLDSGLFLDAKGVVETTVSYLSDSQETFELLNALNSHSDALYAHSLGVSMYSALMAKQVGWQTPQSLYKVSMGALFHDIGKKELDPALLAKPRHALSTEEVRMYETHPTRGMEILSKIPAVPPEIAQIALHHHERDMGTGYPSGLIKAKTNPMARLVAVADEFCRLVIKNPDSLGLPPGDAIERLVTLYGGTIDPMFLAALQRVFKIHTSKAARER